MAKKSTAPAALPKPRVTTKGPHYFELDFGNGAVGRMNRGEERDYGPESSTWFWAVDLPDGSNVTGRALGQRHAFRDAWRAAAQASAPAPVFTAEEIADLADRAERGDRSEATKIMRRVLKARTGLTWSVKGGRGTAYGWLTIDAPPKRCEGYAMSAHDQALLSAVLGSAVSHQGESVRPGRNVRAAYVYRLAGHPIPEDLQITAPAWD